jgi:hypothetical protein
LEDRRSWENNIKMDCGMGRHGLDWSGIG